MSGAASKPRICEFLVQTLHSFSAKLLTWQVAAKTKGGIRSARSVRLPASRGARTSDLSLVPLSSRLRIKRVSLISTHK